MLDLYVLDGDDDMTDGAAADDSGKDADGEGSGDADDSDEE